MVFHHPLPIVSEGASGSQVRPYRMVEAFRHLGYDVEVVAGYARQREEAARRIKRAVIDGRSFAFVYAESTTGPTLLTETHHLPLRPFVDFGLFHWLRSRGVPVGLFYRDVYWRFEHYRRQLPWPKVAVSLPFFYYDWWQYERLVDHLFLPSGRMASALPGNWPVDRLTALPPGCLLPTVPSRAESAKAQAAPALKLFYVGGVTPPLYDLRSMVDAVQHAPGVTLTLCCHESEWQRARCYYGPLDVGSVQLVHLQGEALARHYMEADAFLLARAPDTYLSFAMPIKVFEALGYGLPIITTDGTEAARFVASEGIGWVVAGAQDLRDLLGHLRDNPDLLAEKRRQAMAARERHTWRARARLVADILGAIKVGKVGSAHTAH